MRNPFARRRSVGAGPVGWTWTLTALNGRPDAQPPETRIGVDGDADCTWFDDGLSAPVTFGTAPAVPWDILAVSTNHDPRGTLQGTAGIQLINDYWIRNLSPADLTDLATQGHALLDALAHAAQSTAHTSKLELAGIRVPITSDHEPTREREILASTIHYIPATNNEPPTPFTSIHIIEDAWIPHLTPTALADFTTRARAYFDMLTHALRPALTPTDKPTSPNT